MSSSFSQMFKGSLVDFVNEEFFDGDENRAAEILDFEEFQWNSGGMCETCYFEETRVRITYVTVGGWTEEYQYDGGFAELVRELVKF